MDYRMPLRSAEPLDSQWDGRLYEFVDYVVEKVEEAWEWDNPTVASHLTATLTPSQLALWAVLNANGQICNGGFSQFFFNSYGELAEEALQGFRLLRMEAYAEILEQAYAMFQYRPIPKDREQRIGALADMADAIDAGVEECADDEEIDLYCSLAQTLGPQWDELESRYYALIHREGVSGGYNAAFYRPLVDFIEMHQVDFFCRSLAEMTSER